METYRFQTLLAYGLFGMPLALVALPVYVYVPHFYVQHFSLSLSAIGGILLAARLFDAFLDPALGSWLDRSASADRYGKAVNISLPFLVLGLSGLLLPPTIAANFPLAWLLGTLLVVYLGFSMATIAHQSWGAALTQSQTQRSRLTATREACGLLGVILAAILPGTLGLQWLPLIFTFILFSTALVLRSAPRPLLVSAVKPNSAAVAAFEPFRNNRFRWLFAIFMLNGIASAIPATLFLFFVDDRLQLAAYGGPLLVLYFVAGAASMPGWYLLARRYGEARAWRIAMLLTICVFIRAYGLSAGDLLPFATICALSGIALGADLALPPALLAAVIGKAGHSGQKEGAYFGIWNWGTKMNLALAAGIALPMLQFLGYLPGSANHAGVEALSCAYALLPCALKLLAALMLWRAPVADI
ncbi:MFS transporter [Collimonas sp.]|jgi:GPH family glycoside/pentoside/hexuronide:cation symporter|uniref:MFS transporter n=1 Tax=Collimonas sp. TaxID=1963772 RepID=UPI0037C078E1